MVVKRQTLSDVAYETLKAEILDGRRADGTVINQVTLSRELGMSRVPIREAVQRLRAEGLVTGASYRRVAVAAISLPQVTELIDIREQLEVMAIRRMAQNPSKDLLKRARDLNRKFGSARSPAERVGIDVEFHGVLMSRMPAAAQIVGDIRHRTQKYIDQLQVVGSPRPDGVGEHRLVLDAILHGDPDLSEEHMRKHIHNTRTLIIESYAQKQAVSDD